ncbi:hypothetical protein B0J17DRAFT_631481 [Rhizoctonia solani]|nr:hypothetical protein B0J17DRAFT_631481 [Rhizoctonia solani]
MFIVGYGELLLVSKRWGLAKIASIQLAGIYTVPVQGTFGCRAWCRERTDVAMSPTRVQEDEPHGHTQCVTSRKGSTAHKSAKLRKGQSIYHFRQHCIHREPPSATPRSGKGRPGGNIRDGRVLDPCANDDSTSTKGNKRQDSKPISHGNWSRVGPCDLDGSVKWMGQAFQ